MYENSSRLGYSENAIAQLLRDLLDLKRRVAAVEQQPWSGQGGGGQGGTSGAGYYECTLSASLNAGSSLGGQSVVQRQGSTRTTITTNATIYNDGPNNPADNISGGTVILQPNGDGSFTVIGVYC